MDKIKDSLNIDWKQKFEGKDTYYCWNEFKTIIHDRDFPRPILGPNFGPYSQSKNEVIFPNLR